MKRIITLLTLLLISIGIVQAQYFNKITGVPPANNYAKGYSASWNDYNNDGLDDLIVTDNNTHNVLFKNMGNGVFVKDTLNVIYTTSSTSTLGTCWGDYNNDGNVDLLIVNSANAGLATQHNYLFRNEGNGQWTLITDSPVYTDHGWAISGSFVDYDNDGWLDIYIANFGNGNYLYHNDGAGNFTHVTNAGPIVTDTTHAYTAVWADYDNDGLQDCFVVNYYGSSLPGENDALYHNNGNGTFSKNPSLIVNNDHATDQSASWGDYDNDGYLDLFVTVYGGLGVNHNILYHNNGDGTFTLMSNLQPSIDNNQSFGSAWVDFNNDGRLDLVVANNKSSNRHNFLYRNDGNGVFTNITTDPVVTDQLRSMGISLSDYDNDGYPDIYIDSWSSTTEPGMYHNVGGTNNWLQVKLTGTVSNRSAIGARLTLWTNGQKQIREVASATGIYCSSSFVQTFGLGIKTVVDSLIIRWSSGILQRILNPAIDQRLFVTEPSSRTLTLSPVFLEGLYADAGMMNKTYDENGPHFAADTADLVTVELHNHLNYANIEYSTTAALKTNGSVTINTPLNKNGAYYITVKNRNSIETTTAVPVSFAYASVNYGFSIPTKAYGDNMIVLGDGTAAIYAGDENQDGIVDGTDLSDIGNLATLAISGYLPQDINGDGLIDGSDLSISGNDAALAVGAVTP